MTAWKRIPITATLSSTSTGRGPIWAAYSACSISSCPACRPWSTKDFRTRSNTIATVTAAYCRRSNMANPFRIVSLGDSVPWGQGLVEAQKYDSVVHGVLHARFPGGANLKRLAHSGAIIGAIPVLGNPANGEVPVPRPTIVEQCDNFTEDPGAVDLVVVNGGINDVGVATILNPFALVPSLSSKIRTACHDGMLLLLRKLSAKFTKPACKILVTGYYTILSDQSDPLGSRRLLALHGIAPPALIHELYIIG